MADPVPGVAWRERAVGEGLALRLTWEVDDLGRSSAIPRGTVVGDVTHPELGERRLIRSGHFRVDGGVTEATLDVGGRTLTVRRAQPGPWGVARRRPAAGRLMSRSTPWDPARPRGPAAPGGGRMRARWLRRAR